MTSSIEELESRLETEVAKKHGDGQHDSETGDEDTQVNDCMLGR